MRLIVFTYLFKYRTTTAPSRTSCTPCNVHLINLPL
ncbi:hypothetical protein VP434O481_P0004 [Vibrio phage 434O48-1]|nr:hypothetical protein VP434O481_P0004 [Vibrio phage 434O48-1]